MFKKLSKVVIGIVLSVTVLTTSPLAINADTPVTTDPVAIALADQQALLAQYQQALLLQYQQALLAQYQQALADQYAKALLVQQAFAKQQQAAVQQAYLLNAIQAQQKAQYQSMINATGAEYSDQLMAEFLKNQANAKKAFLGYEGLK